MKTCQSPPVKELTNEVASNLHLQWCPVSTNTVSFSSAPCWRVPTPAGHKSGRRWSQQGCVQMVWPLTSATSFSSSSPAAWSSSFCRNNRPRTSCNCSFSSRYWRNWRNLDSTSLSAGGDESGAGEQPQTRSGAVGQQSETAGHRNNTTVWHSRQLGEWVEQQAVNYSRVTPSLSSFADILYMMDWGGRGVTLVTL